MEKQTNIHGELQGHPPAHAEMRGAKQLEAHQSLSVPRKVMEQIPLGGYHQSDEAHDWKRQHGFTKGKLCLTNLITFYSKVMCFWCKWWTLSTWISLCLDLQGF